MGECTGHEGLILPVITIKTRQLEEPWWSPEIRRNSYLDLRERLFWLAFSLVGACAIYFVTVEILLAVEVSKPIAQVAGGIVTVTLLVLLVVQLNVLTGIKKPEGYGYFIDHVRIENIIKALPVYELEDFGPGFLVETQEGEQIYFCGQILEEEVYNDDGDDVEEVMSETVIFEADHVSHEILNFSLEGERIAVELQGGVNVQDLPLEDLFTGYEVLQPNNESVR